MCITKSELESKVQELRSLKAMKEEIEGELKAVEHEIISYMTEKKIDTEITDTAKITYKPQSRTSLDKTKLTEILGDDLKPFEKVTSFKVLRIKQTVVTATIKRALSRERSHWQRWEVVRRHAIQKGRYDMKHTITMKEIQNKINNGVTTFMKKIILPEDANV